MTFRNQRYKERRYVLTHFESLLTCENSFLNEAEYVKLRLASLPSSHKPAINDVNART
jgi:hypothetical protein